MGRSGITPDGERGYVLILVTYLIKRGTGQDGGLSDSLSATHFAEPALKPRGLSKPRYSPPKSLPIRKVPRRSCAQSRVSRAYLRRRLCGSAAAHPLSIASSACSDKFQPPNRAPKMTDSGAKRLTAGPQQAGVARRAAKLTGDNRSSLGGKHVLQRPKARPVIASSRRLE